LQVPLLGPDPIALCIGIVAIAAIFDATIPAHARLGIDIHTSHKSRLASRRLLLRTLMTETRKMHYVGLWYPLQRIPGFAPCCQASNNHKRVKSSFPQQMRHTGASSFTWSSAVQVDVSVPGKCLDFRRQIIRLQANRPSYAICAWIVVTVAAHIGQQNPFGIFTLQLCCELGDLYPWNDAVRPMLPVQ
jgi:hypothetical protein